MTISNGDYVVTVVTADGETVALGCDEVLGLTDDLVTPFLTADDELVPLRIDGATTAGELCFPVITADDETGAALAYGSDGPKRQALTAIPYGITGVTAGVKDIIVDGETVEVAYISVDSDLQVDPNTKIGSFVLYGVVDGSDNAQLLDIDAGINPLLYNVCVTYNYLNVNVSYGGITGGSGTDTNSFNLLPYASTAAFNTSDVSPPAKGENLYFDDSTTIVTKVNQSTGAAYTLSVKNEGFGHELDSTISIRTYVIDVSSYPSGAGSSQDILAGSEIQVSTSCVTSPFERS